MASVAFRRSGRSGASNRYGRKQKGEEDKPRNRVESQLARI